MAFWQFLNLYDILIWVICMKFVIQRVKNAKVEVDNKVTGEIHKGFLVLIGVTHTDTKEIADYLVKKLINLRVFEDENNKMNLALKDVEGQLLLVSQFTLYADTTSGNRPSFTNAGSPEKANKLYEYFCNKCSEEVHVEKGVFGAIIKWWTCYNYYWKIIIYLENNIHKC